MNMTINSIGRSPHQNFGKPTDIFSYLAQATPFYLSIRRCRPLRKGGFLILSSYVNYYQLTCYYLYPFKFKLQEYDKIF